MRHDASAAPEAVRCQACGWSRAVDSRDVADGPPKRCLVCGCTDLWRQKDFPQRLGLAIVAAGAAISTLFIVLVMPATALGVLAFFALADLVLFALMADVLVCYRCGARHRSVSPGTGHARFSLETAERYRQEGARLAQRGRAIDARQ